MLRVPVGGDRGQRARRSWCAALTVERRRTDPGRLPSSARRSARCGRARRAPCASPRVERLIVDVEQRRPAPGPAVRGAAAPARPLPLPPAAGARRRPAARAGPLPPARHGDGLRRRAHDREPQARRARERMTAGASSSTAPRTAASASRPRRPCARSRAASACRWRRSTSAGDAVLERRYRPRLPVIEIDGRTAFVYAVDAGELEDALLAAGRTRRRADTALRDVRDPHGDGCVYTRLCTSRTPPSRRRRETPLLATERLTVGVAARLSRYLQVLTQAKKMGRDAISSQEISEYTHINATQIRRDLSGFGKFGKRGRGLQRRRADRARSARSCAPSGQHNIALVGAGRLGQAIAGSDVFADHGFNIAAVFDTDAAKVGDALRRRRRARTSTTSTRSSASKNIIVGVHRRPGRRGAGRLRPPRRQRHQDRLQLLRRPAAARRRT